MVGRVVPVWMKTSVPVAEVPIDTVFDTGIELEYPSDGSIFFMTEHGVSYLIDAGGSIESGLVGREFSRGLIGIGKDGAFLALRKYSGSVLMDHSSRVPLLELSYMKEAVFSPSNQSVLVSDGSGYIHLPIANLDSDLLELTKDTSNLRVCRKSLQTVSVVPLPTDSSPWAPEDCQ